VWSEAPSASGLSSSTALILALFKALLATIPAASPVPSDVIVE
jgi:shikimate kinase